MGKKQTTEKPFMYKLEFYIQKIKKKILFVLTFFLVEKKVKNVFLNL